jgi:signal transduction histidine kinase
MASPSPEPTRDPAAYAAPRLSMRRSLVPHSRARHRVPVLDGGHFFEGTRVAADVAVQQERGRVASDLHDTVAQTLYGISLSAARILALLERSETAQVQSVVEELLHVANDGQTELRTLLHDLRSGQPLPLQGGLTGALASLATGLESRTGSQVRLSLADEPDIEPSAKATLFRIAREALHNSEKHARATQVDLVLDVGPADVTLQITDNGRGFDLWETHPGHFGLQLMREHAMSIGAALDLVSAPGRGTQVRIRVVRRR